MATAGDRMFGPNGCSGLTAGTGALLSIPLDFSPQFVMAINAGDNGFMFWMKGMDSGTGWKITGALPGNSSVTETVTVTSNVGQLSDVPAVIESVYVTAGTTSGVFQVIPTGATLATGLVSVNHTTGELTFFAADAVTTALVSYSKDLSTSSIQKYTSTNGIYPGSEGFAIGPDADINIASQNIYWLAIR